MFLEELEDLKDRYPDRFQLVHVLSREPQDAELLSGRIDGDRLARCSTRWCRRDDVDEWLLCGPFAMVAAGARRAAGRAGVVPTRPSTSSCSTSDGEPPRAAGRATPATDGAAPR